LFAVFTMVFKALPLCALLCAFAYVSYADNGMRAVHWGFDTDFTANNPNHNGIAMGGGAVINTTFSRVGGGSLMITNSASYVNVGWNIGANDNFINENSTGWTITAWVYLTADNIGHDACVFCQWPYQLFVGIDQTRELYWEMAPSGGLVAVNTIRGPKSVDMEATVGEWVFVAASMDRVALKGHEWNGVAPTVYSYDMLQDQLNYAASNTQGAYRIGNNENNGYSLQGHIDDLWVFPCPLTNDKLAVVATGLVSTGDDVCAGSLRSVPLALVVVMCMWIMAWSQ